MKPALRRLMRKIIERHEGFRAKIYKDTADKWTIGYGRNLEALGISRKEGLVLLDNDMFWVETEIKDRFPWYCELNDARKAVMLSMVFNLGIRRFQDFIFTLRALEQRDFQAAAREMLDSRWANQVGKRSRDLSFMMRTGTQFPGLS